MDEIIIIPIIVSLVYGAITLYKGFVTKEICFKLIPIIAVALGVGFGVLAFYTTPEIMPADNLMSAILFGGSSGLAATGTNQIFKQLTKEEGNISK